MRLMDRRKIPNESIQSNHVGLFPCQAEKVSQAEAATPCVVTPDVENIGRLYVRLLKDANCYECLSRHKACVKPRLIRRLQHQHITHASTLGAEGWMKWRRTGCLASGFCSLRPCSCFGLEWWTDELLAVAWWHTLIYRIHQNTIVSSCPVEDLFDDPVLDLGPLEKATLKASTVSTSWYSW